MQTRLPYSPATGRSPGVIIQWAIQGLEWIVLGGGSKPVQMTTWYRVWWLSQMWLNASHPRCSAVSQLASCLPEPVLALWHSAWPGHLSPTSLVISPWPTPGAEPRFLSQGRQEAAPTTLCKWLGLCWGGALPLEPKKHTGTLILSVWLPGSRAGYAMVL